MITDYPATVSPTSPPAGARAVPGFGAWRYDGGGRSRARLIAALLLSAGLHAGFFFGFGPSRKAPVEKPKEEYLLQLDIKMPELKELEEIETVPSDDGETTADLGISIPMQADVPTIVQATDFVQQIDFSTLVERPDLSQAKLMTIPDVVRRGKVTEGLGDIFNLADLDRPPEPVFQPSPIYPPSLKHEVHAAELILEFIVDSQGRVLNVVVMQSSHHGFDYAAISGVERWKFRPGMRAGRKVNTRMRVPINFRLLEGN